MKYYSTNRRTPEVSLREAVVASMAPDNGLYMPERIERLPDAFFDGIARLDLHRIACRVADAFFGEEIEPETLRRIVRDTFCFDIPAVRVDDGIWALELFHGPTMAFKDVGARFMARILSHFIGGRGDEHPVTVLVATSGDTGGAVANGFLGVEGIDVVVLYPKGRVSDIQEKQFTTLGRNVTALEIEGTFDDCQRLVKSAFADTELKRRMRLTSANSINVARFLPQTFYFFHAYAQLRAQGVTSPIVVSVPSGNFGNLTAGLFARRMGLPVDRFIAANNANDTFYEYLRTGSYRPRPSVPTLANAMDVGDPNNFARILDLYGRSLDALRADGWSFASHSYTHNSGVYGFWGTGCIPDKIYYDINKWVDRVSPWIGETNLFLAPFGYRATGEALQHVLNAGFNIYCTVDDHVVNELYDNYALQSRIEIGGYSMTYYRDILNELFFDVDSVLDPDRPPVVYDE